MLNGGGRGRRRPDCERVVRYSSVQSLQASPVRCDSYGEGRARCMADAALSCSEADMAQPRRASFSMPTHAGAGKAATTGTNALSAMMFIDPIP